MAGILKISIFLFSILLFKVASLNGEDLSYSYLMNTLESRLKTEIDKPSQILNSFLTIEAIEDLARRSSIRQAIQEGFDLSAAAASFNVSELCLNHTELLIAALLQSKTWAWKMFDALGKLPSGITQGDLGWFGSYDECVSVKAIITNNDTGTVIQKSPFHGKYCQIGIPLNTKDPANPTEALYLMIKIGICLPDSCSSTDALSLANTVLSLVPVGNTSLVSHYSNCQENNLKYDTKAIAVLAVSGVFVAILIVATLYDILAIQLPKSTVFDKNVATLNDDLDELTEHNPDDYKPLLDAETSTSEQQDGGVVQLFLSFSVYTNGKKLLNTHQTERSLNAVHGVRFLSMTWVILGHTYIFGLYNAGNLATWIPKILKRWTFQVVVNGVLAVDSFFTLSGLLMSYLVLKELKKNNGKLNWPVYYFHRFWRLTPPYMLIMMVYVPLFPYFSNGPVFPQQGIEKNFCEDSWWTNLLYINNFVSADKQCFAWTWYLANDMQFYVISPLLFMPLFYSEVIGIIVCFCVLLVVSISAGVISYVNKLPPSLIGGGLNTLNVGGLNLTYLDDYYNKPYCRMGPYIVGIMTGYLLYKTDCRVKINKAVNLAGWALATGAALAVVYGLYDSISGKHSLSVEVSALYNATHRTVWGVCLCWVLFACVTGNGGFVNTILSWSALVPLSRLTYCAYLVHPIIMYVYYFSLRQPLYFTDLTIVLLFLAFVVVSYGVAFIVSLAFESPMMALEKVIFRRERRKVDN